MEKIGKKHSLLLVVADQRCSSSVDVLYLRSYHACLVLLFL